MPAGNDIDEALRDWPFTPGVVSARLIEADDGREVIQMRIELGLLQMETAGRPDGRKPRGHETYLDSMMDEAAHSGGPFVLSIDQCGEADREFLQYYHRRLCWLALRQFETCRVTLKKELQLDPSPALLQMRQRCLMA